MIPLVIFGIPSALAQVMSLLFKGTLYILHIMQYALCSMCNTYRVLWTVVFYYIQQCILQCLLHSVNAINLANLPNWYIALHLRGLCFGSTHPRVRLPYSPPLFPLPCSSAHSSTAGCCRNYYGPYPR
jgi:hypothetical protein